MRINAVNLISLSMIWGTISCIQLDNTIDLSGKWSVQLDSNKIYSISLPGSLSENKLGTEVKDSSISMLSENFTYTGKAVYSRLINIPDDWGGRPLELFLERTKVSTLYVNDSLIGSQNSVSTPHIYVLPKGLPAGTNKLQIEVDNTKSLLPLGGAHAYSEHTQTNWNGILGNMSLRCLDTIEIRNIKIDTDNEGQCSLMLDLIGFQTTPKENIFAIVVVDAQGKICVDTTQRVLIHPGVSSVCLDFVMPKAKVKLWDEYTPNIYTLQINTLGGTIHKTTFGFCDFEAHQGRLLSNGRTVFLRGKHEGGVFPMTGYPSMKKEDWIRYFRIVKSYGINHVRYHSWTPPEAAFDAADEVGVFLQTELPLWGNYSSCDTMLVNYMKTEGERIMEAYGNHPSFVMFTLGNELVGDTLLMQSVVEHLKNKDGRRLYAMGSNNFYWDSHTYPCEDFFVSMRNGKETLDYHTDLRGSFSFADSQGGGLINNMEPQTIRDYSLAIQNIKKPIIGHETGQYQIFPDFKEIPSYTGVLRPINLSIIQKRIEDAGLSMQVENFLKASGALSALCYREEIEMALRTKGFDGFQLLDLEDYPGQGTALVGILNAFMKPKGVITRERWLNFCNDIVPLARFSKYCWKVGETFTADIDIAHYGPHDMKSQRINCILADTTGKILFKQAFTCNLKQGEVNKIASIKIPLKNISKNSQLSLSITLEGTEYYNAWDLYVYKAGKNPIREGIINGVYVTRDIQQATQYIAKNYKVLYIPKHKDIMQQSVGGLFITDFWNYNTFKQTAMNMGKEPSPGTFGLFINSDHPLFKEFPTDFHTNWQWWTLIKHSRPMILDDYPTTYKPIVQVIDNWDRNHKLGLIYERLYSKDKILVCSIDLFACKNHPEAQALFDSLIDYCKNM